MRIRRSMAVVSGGTAERHGGRSLHEIPEFPKPRIPYAEAPCRDTSPEVSVMPRHVTRTPREGCPYSPNSIRPEFPMFRIPYAERILATGRAVSARLTARTTY